ncbi:hypothetical protein RI367_001303 [Sorochytrium milnesiophthora]
MKRSFRRPQAADHPPPQDAAHIAMPAAAEPAPPSLDLDMSMVGTFVRPESLFGSDEFSHWPQEDIRAFAHANGISVRDAQRLAGRYQPHPLGDSADHSYHYSSDSETVRPHAAQSRSPRSAAPPAAGESRLKRSYSIASAQIRTGTGGHHDNAAAGRDPPPRHTSRHIRFAAATSTLERTPSTDAAALDGTEYTASAVNHAVIFSQQDGDATTEASQTLDSNLSLLYGENNGRQYGGSMPRAMPSSTKGFAPSLPRQPAVIASASLAQADADTVLSRPPLAATRNDGHKPLQKMATMSRVDRLRYEEKLRQPQLQRHNSLNTARPSTAPTDAPFAADAPNTITLSRAGSQETVRTLKNDEVEQLKNVVNLLSRSNSVRSANPMHHVITTLPRGGDASSSASPAMSRVDSPSMDLADSGAQVVLTKEQLKAIAPTLPSASEHVTALLGIEKVQGVMDVEGDLTSAGNGVGTGSLARSLSRKFPTVKRQLSLEKPSATIKASEPEELFLLNLDQFLPLVQLLSSESQGTDRDQKLQLMFRVLDADQNGQLTPLDITEAIQYAVKTNGLYLNQADTDLLVAELMSRLDVNKDGIIDQQDFRLATRKWNLNTIGLPLTNTAKTNREIDISANDYLALDMPVTPVTAGFGRDGYDSKRFSTRSIPSDVGAMSDLSGPTATSLSISSPKASRRGESRRKSYNRKSFVANATQWLLRKGSHLDLTSVGGDHNNKPAQHVPDVPAIPEQYQMAQFQSTDSGIDRLTGGGTGKPQSAAAFASLPRSLGSDDEPTAPNSDSRSSFLWIKPVRTYLALEGLKLFWVLMFIAACSGMFLYNFLLYANDRKVFAIFGYSLAVAKGAASLVNFTIMFQFVLVCRGLLTYARNVKVIERYLPIDKNIVWHRYGGAVFVLAAITHSIAHISGVFPTIASTNIKTLSQVLHLPLGVEAIPPYATFLFTSVPGWTGWCLLLIVLLLGATSIARVRNANFEVFWYTHHLFVLMVPLLLLHGSLALVSSPKSWKYMLAPVIIYTIERLVRVKRASEKLEIVQATIENDTVALVVAKPSFINQYLCGQYVFLNVPGISALQWHPFSLTSSANDPYLTLRVKRAGDWTGELFKRIKEVDEERKKAGLAGGTVVSRAAGSPSHHRSRSQYRKSHCPPEEIISEQEIPMESFQNLSLMDASVKPYPRVCIDGVFGAPSQHFFEYDHVMFIATGVGITPFLSILKAIEHHVKSSRRRTVFEGNTVCELVQMQGVDLFWLNRDPKAYQWFSETMKTVHKNKDVRQWLRVHTFVTSAKGREDIRSFLLWWGLQLVSKRYNRCLLTGTEHCVSWGRPHWGTVFEQVARKYPGKKVGVFFCGPKALGKELYDLCRLMNSRGGSSATWFEFAKENF